MARVAKIMAHNVQQQDNVGRCQIIGWSSELWQSNNYGYLSIPLQVIATTIKNYGDIFHKIIKTLFMGSSRNPKSMQRSEFNLLKLINYSKAS